MKIYTDKGVLDLPKEDKIDIKYTNPLLVSQGSLSFPLSLPYTPNNLRVLDFPNRFDRRQTFQTNRTAYLEMGGSIFKCQLRLFQVSKTDGLAATFYFQNGDLYAAIGTSILMTDLDWEVRDPFNGTIAEKITQWLAYFTQIMRKEVTDDYHLFPAVVSYNAPDTTVSTLTNAVITDFKWINGIHANGNQMDLDALNEQMELSSDSGITLKLATDYSTVTVTLPVTFTTDTSIILQYEVGITDISQTQPGGRLFMTIPAGSLSNTISIPNSNKTGPISISLVYSSNINNDNNALLLSIGYGVTPFLKLSFVLRTLFAYFGFTLKENIFDTDPDLQKEVILNNTADSILDGTLHLKQLIPDKTVADFLSAIRNRFNVEFVADMQNNVTVWSWNDMLDNAPDMDLTPFMAGEPKLEYYAPAPLQLSESKSIDLTATDQDSMSAFLLKYKSFTDQSGASPLITGSNPVVFHQASNSFWLLSAFLSRTTNQNNGVSLYKRLGSSFFNIIPVADSIESISAGDNIVPTICISPGIYCPYIGSRRNMNTQASFGGVLTQEEQVNLDLMLCFAVPNIQQTYYDANRAFFVYNYYMGSSSCYDGSGNKWGQLSNQYDSDNGMYANFFKKRDLYKQNSDHSITVNLKLDFMTLNKIINSIHVKKLWFNQPVLIESIEPVIGERIENVEIILRTTRQYVNVITCQWIDFVCELTSSVNTGYQRAASLEILENGVLSLTLSVLDSFTYNNVVYSEITKNDLQTISLTNYNTRITAFVNYIITTYQIQYPEIVVTTDGARIYNTNACPI